MNAANDNRDPFDATAHAIYTSFRFWHSWLLTVTAYQMAMMYGVNQAKEVIKQSTNEGFNMRCLYDLRRGPRSNLL